MGLNNDIPEEKVPTDKTEINIEKSIQDNEKVEIESKEISTDETDHQKEPEVISEQATIIDEKPIELPEDTDSAIEEIEENLDNTNSYMLNDLPQVNDSTQIDTETDNEPQNDSIIENDEISSEDDEHIAEYEPISEINVETNSELVQNDEIVDDSIPENDNDKVELSISVSQDTSQESKKKKTGIFGIRGEIIRVLLIDKNLDDHRLIRETLAESREEFDVLCLENLPEDIEKIADSGVDIILLDLFLDEIEGLSTFAYVHTKLPDLPIIVITGRNDEELAFESVRSGAQDYIVKDYINASMLSRVIRYAIERNRVMAELEKTRLAQLQMKDQFLSHVSHELRTPLTSVYQFITILLDGLVGQLNDEQKEYLEITLRNVVQLKTMINDLLEVTRAQTARLTINPECVSAYEIVSDCINTLKASARSKGINLATEFPANLPPVFADPIRSRAILINLIDNAIKFTPVKGAVTIRANYFEYDREFLRISVSDTGVGIAADEVSKIFEYLYQAESTLESSRKGLGLGLYICKTIVQLHGGQIWTASRLNAGSTFSFTLPIFHGDEN